MWLLHFSKKGPVAAALHAHTATRLSLHKCQNDGTVRSYCEAVNYLLVMYVTDYVNSEGEADMMQFTQPSNRFPTKFDALHNMRSFLGSKSATVHDLVGHANSLGKLQRGLQCTGNPQNNDNTETRCRNSALRGGKANNIESSGSL